MKLYHKSEGVKVLHAECLDMLRKLPDNSIDSIITDPPYGLSNTTPAHVLEALTAWATGDREFIPASSGGFMGKSWDNFVPPPAVWDEALRVLKPGGHLLCFAGTRTMDLMGMSIRLAGFDIRDSIAWMYGSGFPKGQDLGKAIDKSLGTRGESKGVAKGAGNQNTESLGAFNPEYETFEVGSPEAQQWSGWNTALKPAFEPIIMARKPFKGPLFKNVLEHGTGALNVAATRISSIDGDRYPANVILSESQALVLEEQSEELGGASRFFYCAKAPKSERPMVDGKGHPTVKPLALMRYLCTLVTPVGGLILEPFAGSGSTVEAALLEGFRVIASEREEEYLPFIVQRIERIPTAA